MKKINTVLRYVTALLLVSPVLGALGIMPEPTPELYNNLDSYNFIKTLFDSNYIIFLMAIVFAICIYLLITKRTALAALLLLPITVNIIGFHLFLDGGLFTSGAIMAILLFILNLYFLWVNKEVYKNLLEKNN